MNRTQSLPVSKSRSMIVSGLQRIQSWLKRHTPIEALRPSNDTPWRFVFVLPFRIADKFKSQKLTGNWDGKVHQYVSGLDVQTIYLREDSIRSYSTQAPRNREQ